MKYKHKTNLKKLFKSLKYTVKFGDDWVNISRRDGLNCEFYRMYENDSDLIIGATYTPYGDIDLVLPYDNTLFRKIVRDILSFKRTKEITK